MGPAPCPEVGKVEICLKGAGQSLLVTAPAPRSLARLSAYRVPLRPIRAGKVKIFFGGHCPWLAPQVLPAATCAPVSAAVPGNPEF